MWNPAAAGAPPPIANPLHGAPATQQFWPQWQAAVQYYQAASATTTTTDTTTTNEAASGGGDPVVWMEKAAQWAKQKKEEEDVLKQQQQQQLQQLLQQQQQLQQLQQQQQQMLEQQMQVLTQTTTPPQQSQQIIDPAPVVQPQVQPQQSSSHWATQQQQQQQLPPSQQSILQTIMQQSSSHKQRSPPPASQQQWPSSHDRSHDAMRSHDVTNHGHQSWRDQYRDNTDQYQRDHPPPAREGGHFESAADKYATPADSRPSLLETPRSESPQGRQGGPPSRGHAGYQPRGPRGGPPRGGPPRGGWRGRGDDTHSQGPRSRGPRPQHPPQKYGPSRGGHPRNHPHYYDDIETEQHQDWYTEDEEVDHFRSHPPMGRPNQPRSLLDPPDTVSPRPLFEPPQESEHSDYRAPQRNIDTLPQSTDPYYDERRDTVAQPKPLGKYGKPNSTSRTLPTTQPQPFVHPLLARAKQKRMEDPSRQVQPVKMEETSRTFVHPLLAKSAATAAATTAGHQGDQEQKPVVKTEPNDTPAFMPRQVRVNQPPVIKTESDDIDSQLYQSFTQDGAAEDVKPQTSAGGGWKPVVSTSDDKVPLLITHPPVTSYKKEEETEIPGLELSSSRKSSTLDTSGTVSSEWKQQSLQDDVPQVVNTVEVVSEPFPETAAAGQSTAVTKVGKQQPQQMIVETKGQYSFSSRPADHQEEKHAETESADKPKVQQQKKARKVTGKDFLLGRWERVQPNQEQQKEVVEDVPSRDLLPPDQDQSDLPPRTAPEQDNPADRQMPAAAAKEVTPERHPPGQREWVGIPPQSEWSPHQPPRDGNFPPDYRRPPERDYPSDRRPPERDLPPRRRPPEYDYPPDRRPPEREFPPDRRPPEREFPPDRRPPEREFPPDRRPPERDFYFDRRPERDYPGRRPPEWDFPPDRRPPGRDYFPDYRPPDRGFPHDRMPPGRDFPPDRRPPERFPPDHRPGDFPPDQKPSDRDFPLHYRLPERNFPFDRRQGDYPPDRRLPPERDFPSDRRLPPERDFPPDRRHPPERDFPPDRRHPQEREFLPDQRPPLDRRPPPDSRDFPPDRNHDAPVSAFDRLDYGPQDQPNNTIGIQQRLPYREHPPGRHPSDRPPDQEWPPLHSHKQGDRIPSRRLEQRWSPGRDWPPSDHPRRSFPQEWSQKGNQYGEESARPEGSYNTDIHDPESKSGAVPSPANDASVHEAVAQLAEQMKSVKGLASKLNLPNSPKTAKEWQEVAKMVAAAAAAGGSQQKGQQGEEGDDDTQKRVAAMLANDSDSDTENATDVKRSSPAREFDGTYNIPLELRSMPAGDDRQCYSMDYGHGPHFGRRPHDYPPDDPYHHDRPPYWERREYEHFPPGRPPYHRPLSPRPRLPPDYKGVPPPHPGYSLSDWHEGGRPRTPPYPQYGPPLPHDIPTSMLDEMTSDQQLLLAAAVNSGSDSKKKGLPTWLKEGLEQLEREKQRKAEQEATKKKRKSRWSDVITDEDDSSQQNEVNRPSQESDEELQAALVATVRRLLTEILLSVTNSEISAIVRECMEEEETKFKFKIPPLPKRALKKTSLLGLGHYDSDSGSEGSNEEDKGKWVPLPELPNKPAPGMSVKQIAEAFAAGKSKEQSSGSKKKRKSRWSSPEPSKKSRSSSSSKHSSSKSKSKSRYKH